MTSSPLPPLRLGIAGLGTVGAELVGMLQNKANFLAQRTGRTIDVVAVSARNPDKDRGVDLSSAQWFSDPVEMASSAEIDAFVELVGGADGAAKNSVEAALSRGLTVITANKALLADHGLALAALAEENDTTILFEAAVAGGIPVIKALREQLAANQVDRVYGILNGTCNYILTRMEREGISFDDCLADAQALGYAEADPTFDIEGFDAAHKLALLTSIAFGTEPAPSQIAVDGITSISSADISAAAELGYRIRLLGFAMRGEGGVTQRVHPTMVPETSAIAAIDGVTNAVAIEGDYIGATVLQGPGAGGKATASAVAGDIVDLARGTKIPTFGIQTGALAPFTNAEPRPDARFYLRLHVTDKAGVFAAIAGHMADNSISLESIVQRRRSDEPDDAKMIILITHGTTRAAVDQAVKAIAKDGYLVSDPQMIRIEHF
ncbi:MAG: homoserine dehydrogenase [Pseudomonadota bacterium]